MSALTFGKPTESMTNCETYGCVSKGRYPMLLCGYPVPSELPYNDHVCLCLRCKKEAIRVYNEFSGLTAYTLLQGSKAERSDGVDSLRSIGFSPRAASEMASAA